MTISSAKPLNCLSVHHKNSLSYETGVWHQFTVAGAQCSTWLTGITMLLLSSGRDSYICLQMSGLRVVAGRHKLCKAEAVSARGEKQMPQQYKFGLYCLPSATSQGISKCKILNTEVLCQVCLFSLCLLCTAGEELTVAKPVVWHCWLSWAIDLITELWVISG